MGNLTEQKNVICTWEGCEAPALPDRTLCERHCSNNPSKFKPKPTPTIEMANVLLSSTSKAKRKQGMQMLCELHADELIVSHALVERDASILKIASEALAHYSQDLIRHMLTQPSVYDASLFMRFCIARGNYLYAESTIYEVYSHRRTLTLHVIEGIGRAYVRSLSSLLHKYLAAPLELYEDALHSKGSKAVAGVDGVAKAGWSRTGWSAILSTIALARLDSESDLSEVARLLEEAEQIHHALRRRQFRSQDVGDRISRAVLGTMANLEWVLFDQGVSSTHEKVLSLVRNGTIEVLPDFATTLLKHREYELLKKVVREFPLAYFVEADFYYWPLMNWLTANGFLAKNEYGSTNGGSLYQFWHAFEQRTEPPPWWQWQ